MSLQDDVVEDSMVVDPRHHRHFVCRRGQVLRELAEEYGGVAVSFPRTGANSQRVALKGAKDCVEAAKKRIQEIIEDLVSTGPLQDPSSSLGLGLEVTFDLYLSPGVPGDCGGGGPSTLPPRHHGAQRLPHPAHHQGA